MEMENYLWLPSLLAVIFADQQPWISPLDIEVSIDRDAEVLVRHLLDKELQVCSQLWSQILIRFTQRIRSVVKAGNILYTVAHLGNVFDVNPNCDIGGPSHVWKVIPETQELKQEKVFFGDKKTM